MIQNNRSKYRISRQDLDRLMYYHDKLFVSLAYKLLLGREPDPTGMEHYLDRLRGGEDRREISFLIAKSDEAQSRIDTSGLFNSYEIWRKVQRIPVVGSLILLCIAVVRIKSVVREFRRVQNAVFGIFQEIK
jgi:hypothetical protein